MAVLTPDGVYVAGREFVKQPSDTDPARGLLVLYPDAQNIGVDDGSGVPGSPTTGVAMPTQGQMWPTGLFNPKATPMERVTATLTTASLAADASESGTVTLSDGYRLLRVTTSRPARVRLYTTTAKRDADASRALGTDPTGDHGLVLDFVSTASVLAADLSPTVDGFDGATTPTGAIPYRVTNKDTVTGTVVVTFNWIVTEA